MPLDIYYHDAGSLKSRKVCLPADVEELALGKTEPSSESFIQAIRTYAPRGSKIFLVGSKKNLDDESLVAFVKENKVNVFAIYYKKPTLYPDDTQFVKMPTKWDDESKIKKFNEKMASELECFLTAIDFNILGESKKTSYNPTSNEEFTGHQKALPESKRASADRVDVQSTFIGNEKCITPSNDLYYFADRNDSKALLSCDNSNGSLLRATVFSDKQEQSQKQLWFCSATASCNEINNTQNSEETKNKILNDISSLTRSLTEPRNQQDLPALTSSLPPFPTNR